MVQVWFDPLTKKRFNTENTYQAHVNSKKYKELLKKLGKETPAPVVSIKRPDGPGETPWHVVSHCSQWSCCVVHGCATDQVPLIRQVHPAWRACYLYENQIQDGICRHCCCHGGSSGSCSMQGIVPPCSAACRCCQCCTCSRGHTGLQHQGAKWGAGSDTQGEECCKSELQPPS